MKDKIIVGVDVSKAKLDACVMFDGKVLAENVTRNSQPAIFELIRSLATDLQVETGRFLVCAEFTGQYTWPLALACKATGCPLWLENPTQIKLSAGMRRGKNDPADARMIAEYAWRHIDKARCHNRPTEQVEELKQLARERALYVVDLSFAPVVLIRRENGY